MFVRTYGAASRGVDVLPVSVELRSGRGIQFHVAGMSGSLARDAFLRIRGALQAGGWAWPREALTVSLSPGHASLHPEDLDLPLALVVLAQIGAIPSTSLPHLCSVGSLGLDGSLRGHPTGAHAALAAAEAGCRATLVPAEVLPASSGSGPDAPVFGARNLREVVDHLTGTRPLPRWVHRAQAASAEPEVPLNRLHGDEHHLRGLLLAAAGEHHVLMLGSPGTGKSLSARALHGILPALDRAESQTLRRLHAAKGLIRPDPWEPPLRSPHAGSGVAALIGSRAGGRHQVDGGAAFLPGELSLAHRGLLILDELPEWSRPAMETLRIPLERGVVDLARAAGSIQLPARCLVAATANPCPCGYFMDAERRCRCTPAQVRNYLKRLSGPLIDRFPIHLETRVAPEPANPEQWDWPTEAVAARALVQRVRQADRSNMRWTEAAECCLRQGMRRWRLSGRAQTGLRQVAQTHALCLERNHVEEEDAAIALQYRVFDRAGWLESAWSSERPKHRG